MSVDPHTNPKGPGDARPTALQIIEREHAADRLAGKCALITGSSSGIGAQTAKALAIAGVHLFLPVRDMAAAAGVISDIQHAANNKAKIDLLSLDLNSLDSVRQCATELRTKTQQLNLLILNAGVMAAPEGRTADGFETQFGVNHVAHFLLFQLLKPMLLTSSTPSFNSRVVILSSSGHNMNTIQFDDYDMKKSGYDKWKAYGQSKTANIYLALEIERRYGDSGLHAWAVHPGAILTNLQRHMPDEEKSTRLGVDEQGKPTNPYFKSEEQGAATTVWAATAKELEGKGGKYLENVSVAKPRDERGGIEFTGHSPWCYDYEAAKRLYDESLELVGLEQSNL